MYNNTRVLELPETRRTHSASTHAPTPATRNNARWFEVFAWFALLLILNVTNTLESLTVDEQRKRWTWYGGDRWTRFVRSSAVADAVRDPYRARNSSVARDSQRTFFPRKRTSAAGEERWPCCLTFPRKGPGWWLLGPRDEPGSGPVAHARRSRTRCTRSSRSGTRPPESRRRRR